MGGFVAQLSVSGVQEDCTSQLSSRPSTRVSSTAAPFGLGAGPDLPAPWDIRKEATPSTPTKSDFFHQKTNQTQP